MTDLWMPRLSEYLDGDLSQEQCTGLEQHLAGCAACRTTLDELKRVVARAQALEDREPATDLWRGIAKRITSDESADVVPIESRRRTGRMSVTAWQLAAAAVVLVTLGGGATLLVQRVGHSKEVAAAVDTPVRSGAVARPVRAENRGYDAAIADL